MKRFAFFLSMVIWIIAFQVSKAQAPDWTRVLQFNTFGTQSVNVVTADANNLYAAVSISSNISFEGTNLTCVGLKDMILIKTNNAGDVSWVKQVNANSNGTIYANAIKSDASGNIYVSGVFSGTSTIGSSTITSDLTNNSFVAKFDTDGNGLWATSFMSTGSGSSRIALDASGNTYLISSTSKLLKFNSAGAKQWEQSYTNKTLQAIAVYGSNLYLGGCLQSGTTSFGAILLNSLGGNNTGYLVKGDLDGNYTNSAVLGGSTFDEGSSVSDIAIDNSGNLIITGGFVLDLELGTLSVNGATSGSYVYIAKCDNSFNFSWATGSTKIVSPYKVAMWNYRVFVDNSSNVYQYGVNPYSFSYGSVSYTSTGANQFLFKFDSNGSPTNGYALSNSNLDKTIITPSGKVVLGSTYNQENTSNYGNFYLAQLNNDITANWEKVSTNSLTGTAKINNIRHDADGNSYLATRILGYCDFFGTIINTNKSLTIISKHDIDGNLLWMNQIADISSTGTGTTFTLDKDNNIITVGLFITSLVVGTKALTTSNSSYEGYVAKFNSSGDFLWAETMNLGENVGSVINVATDKDNNVVVSGVNAPSNYLVKFDSNGNQLWAKTFPMESYYTSLVSTDDNNSIYLATEIYLTTSTGTTTIGTVTLNQTNDDGSIALIKFDSEGNTLWAKTYGGVTGASYPDGFPVDIKSDAAGNSYVWGWCTNNAIFGTSTFTNPFTPNQKFSYFIAKINTSGDVVWAKPIYETKYAFNYYDLLDLDKSGNIYIGGHFNDKIKFDGNEYIPEGLNDFFAIKLSNDGDLQWMKTIPSDGASIINALSVFDNDVLTLVGLAGKSSILGSTTINKKSGSNCIMATLGNLKKLFVSSNNLTVAAAANSTTTFNITSNISWTVSSDQTWLTPSSENGSGNATITLTAAENSSSATRSANIAVEGTGVPTQTIIVTQEGNTSAINVVDNITSFYIYPNPNNGQFKLNLANYKNDLITVTITNIQGRIVKDLTFKNIPLIFMQDVDLQNIEKGIYFVTVKTTNSKEVKSLIVL